MSNDGDRRLGVLGTLVWDTIHGPDEEGPVEEWGGIAYSLSAFEAVGPPGWRAMPIVKVGRDLRDEAFRLLRSYSRVSSLEGVRVVEEPNNRVDLHYLDESTRRERLRGGVPGWEWRELAPLVAGCDAVYVNFIAGWELRLPAARRLHREFGGPAYADLHSLLLEVGSDGARHHRPIDEGGCWVRCFDYVQVNEEELAVLAAGSGEDPWTFAASAVEDGARAVFVTRGRDGASWVAGGGGPGSARRGRLPPPRPVEGGDPTGCGDVWGVGCFGALLQGAGPEEAVARANEVAARNAETRGGTGLLG